MAGVEDGGSKQVAPRQLAKTVMKLLPAIDRAGNGDRVDAELRHLRNAFGIEVLDGECFGRPAAGIQAIELAGFRIVVDGKEIAADSVHHGLNNAEYGIGGNACVDGGTALLKHTRTGLRSLDLAG